MEEPAPAAGSRTSTGGGDGSGGAGGGGGEPEGPPVFYAYDSPPRALKRFEPVYPPEARAQGLEGAVVVNLNIDERGRIMRAWVAQAAAPEILIDAALEAAYHFEFVPGSQRGVPVKCTVAIPFEFRLRRTLEVDGGD